MLLRLLLLTPVLAGVRAVDIIYPKIGTVYPATGSYDVQWQSTDYLDPSELAIYLVTYQGQNISDQRPCIVAPITDDSTAITLSEPAPPGDSWTWMFYDNNVIISPGNNYIAQSVHFQIAASSSSPSATTSSIPTSSAAPPPDSSFHLTPAMAAGIGVGATLVVVVLCSLVGYFCFYRRLKLKKRETITAIPYTPGHRYSKQELDSKVDSGQGMNSTIADIKTSAHHEMEVYPTYNKSAELSSPLVASPGAELSVAGRHSRIAPQGVRSPVSPWEELPLTPVRHELYHDPRRAFAQELPGDFEMGNSKKEWH